MSDAGMGLSGDDRALLGVFGAMRGPAPLAVVLNFVNPIPNGWAKLRLFAPCSPWHCRTGALIAAADGLASRGLLARTRARRLPLASEYKLTDAGWWAAFDAAGESRDGADR